MAEFEKEEYKFPDEVEKDSKETESKLEIEIEDDTPEEDKNKSPMPKEVRDELYKDELEDYSSKVKKKLLALKKLAHDERREKEQALREQSEALSVAQRLVEENKRLKSSLSETEKATVSTISKNIEFEKEAAKRAYKEAYESGDTDKIIDAQQRITEIALRDEKVKQFKPRQIEDEVYTAPKIQADPTAVRWKNQNPWFGQDKLMTATALAMHELLKEEGVVLASEEYYKRIDGEMRHRFSDRFEKDERPTKSAVVAPATRSTASKTVRLKSSQLSIAKKLGLTPEQYAHAVLQMEN
jgi:hypothetical protein